MYTAVALPIKFLLQAFKITQLFDADTEQGRDSLFFLRVPVLRETTVPY